MQQEPESAVGEISESEPEPFGRLMRSFDGSSNFTGQPWLWTLAQRA